jgi:hypothetical protein
MIMKTLCEWIDMLKTAAPMLSDEAALRVALLSMSFEREDRKATQMSKKRNLCVDGHEFDNPESNWAGDGEFPPFVVFDIDAQENLPPYYATRSQAQLAMERLLAPIVSDDEEEW